MKLKVYEYKNCGTCKKALKFLDERKISYEKVPIRESPPTKDELKRMLSYVGDIRKLFNTSGGDYKELNLKENLSKMAQEEALDLLASHGNLVKRPFVLIQNKGLVGFDEEKWKLALNGTRQ